MSANSKDIKPMSAAPLTELRRKRCFNHPDREAAAICPECGRYFCRECVTEHENRVLCANCLQAISAAPAPSRPASMIMETALFFGALLFLWFFFYNWGQVLLTLPASFHEGSLWKDLWHQI